MAYAVRTLSILASNSFYLFDGEGEMVLVMSFDRS